LGGGAAYLQRTRTTCSITALNIVGVAEADRALYRAKAQGRDQVQRA
jgi:GGDEF domain-containing protein